MMLSIKKLISCRCRVILRVGKVCWRRKWQPILVFLPEEAHRRAWWTIVHQGSERVRHDRVTEHSGLHYSVRIIYNNLTVQKHGLFWFLSQTQYLQSHILMGRECHCITSHFLMLSFKPAFLLSFTLIKRLLVPLRFLPLEWCHQHIWSCWYFSLQSWFQLVAHPAQHFTWCTLHTSRVRDTQRCIPFPIWTIHSM